MSIIKFISIYFILLSIIFSKSQIEKNGDILRLAIPGVSLGITLLENKHEGSMQLLKSIVLSQLVTEGLKVITHKRRPNGVCCKSFPSGHVSGVFTAASFIQKRYGFKYSIPLYLASGYVAYTRVVAEKHFIEDVIAGAAIGVLSSFYFTKKYNKTIIYPQFNNEYFGLEIIYKY